MASMKRFLLLFTSLLVAALVVYMISSKTEHGASKIPAMPSWKENTRAHSNNVTPASRQRLQNGKLLITVSSFAGADTGNSETGSVGATT